MADDALVIFTPSGRRGRFAEGTTVLDAARALGVDIDSVCGGRGICGRCQVTQGLGAFPKHGIVSDPAVHEAVMARVTEAAAACSLSRVAMAPSAITGATGNQEFFLHLRFRGASDTMSS